MVDKEINRVVLSCDKLEIGYLQNVKKNIVLRNLNLHLHSGQLTALMGQNGSGKSTLIRTLCSLQNPIAGSIYLNGEILSKKAVAKQIAVVLTSSVYAPNFTVFDMVCTARIPHTNWLGRLQKRDIEVVNESIDKVGIVKIADRKLSQLSDGERQKMMIAKALAQESKIIILDEPTAHLDLINRVEISKMLQDLAHKENKAILMATHELDLAIQTADEIWLLDVDMVHIGTPEDLIVNKEMQRIFAKMSVDFDHSSGSFRIKPQKLLPICFLKRENSIIELWTERLLLKFGFYIDNNNDEILKLSFDSLINTWLLVNNGVEKSFNNFADLGDELRRIAF